MRHVDAVDEFGSTALMYAGLYSDAEIVRQLLDKGTNPNRADDAGATALMWAISDPAKVRLLIQRGANVNAVSTVTGRTPLLIAAHFGKCPPQQPPKCNVDVITHCR